MPALRQLLSRPDVYLALIVLVVGLGFADTYRPPERQLVSEIYVTGVHAYQKLGRPLLEGRIQCRYEPTCSEYSIEAVRTLGLRRGLAMSARRIRACKIDVPLGTYDPVPERS